MSLAPEVRVNCIAPGLIKTDFAKALWDNPDNLKASTARSPLLRIGVPDEIAGAAVFMGSRAGDFMTGQTVVIDGVWSTVGSTNLDWRSFLHNHELNAVMLGADFGQQLQAMFERDLAASDAIELAAWERRSPVLRVQEWFGRLWEYWL